MRDVVLVLSLILVALMGYSIRISVEHLREHEKHEKRHDALDASVSKVVTIVNKGA